MENYDINTYKPDFTLMGTLNLEKSLTDYNEKKDSGVKSPQRIVYGEISNNQPDEEGEILMQKSLDFDYFDSGKGFIKYEHSPKNHPKNIIGTPLGRKTLNDRTVVKAAIFEGTEYADATWDLVKALDRHNKNFPDNQQTLGWSVEGDYIDGKRRKGGLRKAKVINVVVTPNPVNKSTYLQTVEENHTNFFKSLSATPTSTDLASKTGGDAIVKENIDDEVIDTTEAGDSKKKKKKKKQLAKSNNRRKTMFENKEQAVEFYKSHGIDDDKADEMANEHFNDDKDREEDDSDLKETNGLLKSLTQKFSDLSESFKKSNDDDDVEAEEYAFDDEEADVTEVLSTMDKAIRTTGQTLDELTAYTFERDESLAEAMAEVGSLEDKLDEIKKSLTVEIDDKEVSINQLVAVMAKSISKVPVDINQFDIMGDPQGDGNPDIDKLPSWQEMNATLEKGLESQKITQSDASRAESAWRSGAIELVKTVIDKCQ